jgi:hypothetical protein
MLAWTTSRFLTAQATGQPAGSPPAGVAATVDGHPISIQEVEDAAIRRYGPEILNNLIDAYLIDREAMRLKIEVSQAEIDDEVRALADAIRPKTLEEGLKEHHQTRAELEDDFRHRLLGLKLAAIGVKPGRFVHARLILLKTGAGSPQIHTDAETMELLKTVRRKLNSGADFAVMARQYSEDPSARERGGDIGVLYQGAPYEDEVVEAALALKPGEITEEPVRTPSGYCLIEAISTEKAHPADEDPQYAEAQSHSTMYQGNRNFHSYMVALRAGAAIKRSIEP